MLVWAALIFNDEFLQPAFDSGNILFPADSCTQFYIQIDDAIDRAKENMWDGGIWVAQVEIKQEDLLMALNDFSYNITHNKAYGREDVNGIRATIKQKVLCKD